MAFSQLYYGTKMFNTLSGPIVLSHVNWLLQAEVVSLCLTAQESVSRCSLGCSTWPILDFLNISLIGVEKRRVSKLTLGHFFF